MINLLAVPAWFQVRAIKDCCDLVVSVVVFIPGHDQKAVMGRRPSRIGAHIALNPLVALLNGSVMHVVVHIRYYP